MLHHPTTEMDNLFGGIYKKRKVLLTGHTGFKGSWLMLWLTKLGADVLGYALEPPTEPNHFNLLKIKSASVIDDIRDPDKLMSVVKQFQPEIVFHLAAQPLVRDSYILPVMTFETNVMGTVYVLEACRKINSVKAVVNITSDKCYDNKEWIWGYKEIDPMGGSDPYSASKGCSELITKAYRQSYFDPAQCNRDRQTLLASARAGNVVGGGDWAKDRLIPDIMKAAGKNSVVCIRNPQATRPWQHVLEPLSGYLLLGWKLLEGKKEFASEWNFGPHEEISLSVELVAKNLKRHWDRIRFEMVRTDSSLPEANLLKLDSTKANTQLKWRTVWSQAAALKFTADWYRDYYEKGEVDSKLQLMQYVRDACKKELEWTLQVKQSC